MAVLSRVPEACTVGHTFDISNVKGAIKCEILLPRDFFITVLPYKIHKPLMLPLYRRCVEDLDQNDRLHYSEDDRSLQGTWMINEIKATVAEN